MIPTVASSSPAEGIVTSMLSFLLCNGGDAPRLYRCSSSQDRDEYQIRVGHVINVDPDKSISMGTGPSNNIPCSRAQTKLHISRRLLSNPSSYVCMSHVFWATISITTGTVHTS